MKLKLKQVRSLYLALTTLHGQQRIVASAKSKAEEVVLQPFRFPAKMTWNIVKNLGILRRKSEELDEHHNATLRKHSGGADQIADPRTCATPEEAVAASAAQLAFAREMTAFLTTEEEIPGLLRFAPGDFNLYDAKDNPDGNVIPATTLDALEPLIHSETTAD
jgi:hypothetical protein